MLSVVALVSGMKHAWAIAAAIVYLILMPAIGEGGASAKKSGGNPHLMITSVVLSNGTNFTTPASGGSTIDTLTATCASGSCAGATFALSTAGACSTASSNGSFAISGSNLNIGGSTVNAGSYPIGIAVTLVAAQNSGVCFPFTLVGTTPPTISGVILSNGNNFTTPASSGSTIDTLTATCSVGSCTGATFALATTGACSGASSNSSFAISTNNLKIGGSTVNAGTYPIGIAVTLAGATNSGTCYPFTLTGANGGGTAYLSAVPVNPALPIANGSTAINTTIPNGGQALLTWDSSGAGTCTGTGFSTSGAISGIATVSPTTTTTYTVTCGSQMASATVTVSGTLINASAGVGTGGCTGSGTTGSPWNYLCIQNAVNSATTGDTVLLAGGDWRLSTGDATYITISKAINLVGVGSGNTFDAYGHINNISGASQCPTSGTSITCVYETGTSFQAGTGAGQACFPGTSGACTPPAGFILNGQISFGTAACANISNIFFDGSQATDGGDTNGLLNFKYCGGPLIVNNVRFLAYNQVSLPSNGETQFAPLFVNGMTIQNSLFADPSSGVSGGLYPNAQIAQVTGGNTRGRDYLVQNNVFYQGAFNPITISFVTFQGNMQYDYHDGLGNSPIIQAAAYAGAGYGGPATIYCAESGQTSGQCVGDFNLNNPNNLFYGGTYFAIGGGVNDPSTSGGLNNLNWTGNWVLSPGDGGLGVSGGRACVWGGSCVGGGVVGMGINMSVDTSCNVSNGGGTFDFTNNSFIALGFSTIDGAGNASAGLSCLLGDGTGGMRTPIPINVYGLNAQKNYISSANNNYVTNANTISPVQMNNFCAGSGGVGTVTGCATSGFTTPPTCSLTLGTLSNGVVQIASASFTAQYGAVEWLTSTSSTPPLSSDSRWNSNSSFFTSTAPGALPPSAANTYIPPTYLSGVSHGSTVYLWTMDSASNISGACSQALP